MYNLTCQLATMVLHWQPAQHSLVNNGAFWYQRCQNGVQIWHGTFSCVYQSEASFSRTHLKEGVLDY